MISDLLSQALGVAMAVVGLTSPWWVVELVFRFNDYSRYGSREHGGR